MATLNGIVRFSGQVGDFIFYRRGKKDVVRSKALTHQLSENSKKSAKDFGEASRNAAYIRKAFAAMVKDYGTGDLTTRLTKRMHAVFKSITAAHAGHKKISDGNLKLMEGFEFNAYTSLGNLLLQMPKMTLQDNGFIGLRVPKLATGHCVKAVGRSDAYMLQVMVFNLDLQTGHYEILKVHDLKVSLNLPEFPGAKVAIPIEMEDERAVFVAIGISYLHDGHRKEDRRYFACQIIKCMHLKDGVEVEFIEPLKEAAIKVEEEEMGLSWEMGERE